MRGGDVAPTWQSVSKTHEYQRISDFLVTDSHVAALLGMTEKGLSTRCGAALGPPLFLITKNLKKGVDKRRCGGIMSTIKQHKPVRKISSRHSKPSESPGW